MDHRRFDTLARALGGASSRRAALGALLSGLAAGAAATDLDAKRRRRRCDPACPAGQTCVKGTCTCANGGTLCGANCCAAGQTCQGGACVDPLPQCLAFGAACKNAGVPCCDGTVCGSGQGGKGDVACHVPAGGRCERTAQCVFGSSCEAGTCVADPQPTPAPACAVCASGCPFSTIEAAVAAATVGNEIVTVAAGTYTLAALPQAPAYLDIVRPLTLRACVPGQPVVVVCPIGNGLPNDCVSATGPAAVVTVEGIEIQSRNPATGEQSGVSVINGGSLTLRDVAVRGFYYGVYAYTSTSAQSTVTTSGTVSIATETVSGTSGIYAGSATAITIGGPLLIANATTGLKNDVGGTITCVPPTTYSTAPSVSNRCGTICPDSYPGCGCCP